MPLIQVRDLSVHYPRAHAPALQHASFEVAEGEALLLLGPSGSGKSTIGLCLAGLIPASVPAAMQGQILFGGRDAAEMPVGRRTAMLGMVFQDPEAQFCMLRVADEVAFGLENLGVPRAEMDQRIADALALVGLDGHRDTRVDRLSGGEKQRLALACALARRPPILFLDEPTANLDPATRYAFYGVVRTLRRAQPELTLIIVEHILDDLITLVDRVLLLGPGGVVCTSGAPREVFERSSSELEEMGIWLPQVTALGQKLRMAGVALSGIPLTVPEAAAQLRERLVRTSAESPARAERTGDVCAASVRGLSFRFADGPLVLRNVGLDVPLGAFLALLGPNGTGKTTLASHVAAVLRPPAGTVRLLGDDIVRLTTAQITERVGYVFQNPEHQFVEQHVDDELAYSLRARGRPVDEVRSSVEQLLTSFGLAPYRRHNPFSLSQGQKRRLSVATMLIVGQRLLVLDEPTFGQDRHTAHALMERLRALHRGGVTILLITHDMQVVADYADSVAVLADGEICYAGAPSTLFADQAMLAAASLRALPLHELARALGVAYSDGNLPLTLRDWFPFFGLDGQRVEPSRDAEQEGVA